MEPLVQQVYNELKYLNKIANQTDFANKLGYGKSYVSTLLRSVRPLHAEVQRKLGEVFGVSVEWMASNGHAGTMFANAQERDRRDKEAISQSPNTNYTLMTDQLMHMLQQCIENNTMLAESNSRLVNSNALLTQAVSGKENHQTTRYPKAQGG